MSNVQVQIGGNTVQVQVQSSGFARANAAVTAAAASATAAAASAASAAATLAAAALKANNLSDLASASTARTNLGVAIGTNVQAYSANLDEYAAVNPTAAGLALLDDADASAQRTTLGLGSIATQAASAVAITGGSIAGITDLAVADGGTGASSASAARDNLGLTIGTNVQAYDADLTTWAGITPGTGVATALAANVGSAGAFTTFNGAGGTPSSLTLTNATGLPVAGGGTGAATAADARTNLAVVGTAALEASTGAALVGSIATGTGATARTVQAKLRDYVSIKDFGAVCDGVTDDTAAIHAAMNAHDNVLVPGYTKANIVWPRQGVRLFGTGVGEFDPVLFTYQRGTLIEAFNTSLPAITINPDTVGANLNHCVIENMCVAGVGRVGDGIAVLKTTGTYKVADLIINNVSTRSARYGLYVTAELLWASFDHLTHDFCLDGCRIVTTSFVNGLVAGVWAARRCYRHGFYWNKTDVSNSGFQAWDIGLLSADYNGDFNSTATAQAGVIGVYINGFEGLKIGQVVAEGNGMDQAAADGHGILIEGSVNRGIVLQSVAIESSPLPFRWKGDVASGYLGDFYRFSSSTGQVPGIITATSAMAADGTTSPPKIMLGGNFAGEMRTTFDGSSGGYPTNPGMDYIPAQGTTLHVADRTAITINCGVSSKTITALTRPVIGSTLTLWNYAASTTNTLTIDGGLMQDTAARIIPPNEARSFVVVGFPSALKLVQIGQNYRDGSATYDPPSLADGAGVTTTVTVSFAALGDFAEASFSLDLQGIMVTAWVSAADTVSVRFQNETGGTIDLASGTILARARKT